MTTLVSVGVSDYTLAASLDDRFLDLPYASSDAERFSSQLASIVILRKNTLLTSAGGIESKSLRNNIFRVLVQSAGNGEEPVLFYFAGHGIEYDGELHLCPEDFDPRIPAYSSIPLSDIVELLAKRVGWALVVLDSCRSPLQGSRGIRALPGIGRVMVADNICMFLACSSNEQASEVPSIRGKAAGGIFTHFLLDAIISEAGNSRHLCLGSVFEIAQRETSRYSTEMFEKPQTPRSVGHYASDLFLGPLSTTSGS